jgi:hypothetical protein
VAVPSADAFKGDIGYLILQDYLGDAMPDGSGIVVSQVEAFQTQSGGNDAYLPSSTNPQFDGKTIIAGGSGGSGTSLHATGIGLLFYGNTSSVASGITQITAYQADHYMNNILKLGGSEPLLQSTKVQNHSWVGGFSASTTNIQVMQRLDYVIDVYEMTTVVGMDPASGNTMTVWPLLTQGYNSIAVGRSNGVHATGATTLSQSTTSEFSAGRVKPDLVAPLSATSDATAVVSSVAAALHESGAGTSAVLSEPMKAILLAGATKQGEEWGTWTRSATHPLDDTYGAGEVNVLNSYLIQAGGEFDGTVGQPATPADDYGWDYGIAPENSALHYSFEVPEFYTVHELSAVLAWNIEITDTNSGSQFFPHGTLVDLDLKLYDSSSSFLGSMIDQSISSVDNVEHVYQTDLSSGTYTLQVVNNELDAMEDLSRDFGLAWRLSVLPTYREQGDYNGNGIVESGDYIVWRNSIGSQINLQADGDMNGVVDQNDYNVWSAGFGQDFRGAGSGSVVASAVPEPTSLLILAAVGLAALGHRRRDRNEATH